MAHASESKSFPIDSGVRRAIQHVRGAAAGQRKWGFAQAVLAAVRDARGIRKDRARSFRFQLNGRLANSSVHV
jgi:hypothetical protein